MNTTASTSASSARSAPYPGHHAAGAPAYDLLSAALLQALPSALRVSLRFAYVPIPCCFPGCKIDHSGWGRMDNLTDEEIHSFDRTKLLFDQYDSLLLMLAIVDRELRACQSPQPRYVRRFRRRPGSVPTPPIQHPPFPPKHDQALSIQEEVAQLIRPRPVPEDWLVTVAEPVEQVVQVVQVAQAPVAAAESAEPPAAATATLSPKPKPCAVTKPGTPAKAHGPRRNVIETPSGQDADRSGAGRGAGVRTDRDEARSIYECPYATDIAPPKKEEREALERYTTMLYSNLHMNHREVDALKIRRRLEVALERLEQEFRQAKALGLMPWMD
ncbi:hypothetical protein SEPCBS119000_006556 [Sporothrix epigloea]|uniref:Uncharacterized protein n=1 Tax=Sporothrix epigloea TaxID=1892477 RepID=A0ABP0E3K9_9PEZI